eukprot:3858005-Alexandrium_andersonii.AAC.1
MKATIRSTSQAGVWRRSKTALTQAGSRRSKALLWSIRRTARPPGMADPRSSSRGSQASEIGPGKADWSRSLGEPSRSDKA